MNRFKNFWCIAWLIIAVISMVAMILGHRHQILGVVIGTLMMTACSSEAKEDQNPKDNETHVDKD